MGVGVEGEACGEVAEHTADRLDVYTILQSDGRKGAATILPTVLLTETLLMKPESLLAVFLVWLHLESFESMA